MIGLPRDQTHTNKTLQQKLPQQHKGVWDGDRDGDRDRGRDRDRRVRAGRGRARSPHRVTGKTRLLTDWNMHSTSFLVYVYMYALRVMHVCIYLCHKMSVRFSTSAKHPSGHRTRTYCIYDRTTIQKSAGGSGLRHHQGIFVRRPPFYLLLQRTVAVIALPPPPLTVSW